MGGDALEVKEEEDVAQLEEEAVTASTSSTRSNPIYVTYGQFQSSTPSEDQELIRNTLMVYI